MHVPYYACKMLYQYCILRLTIFNTIVLSTVLLTSIYIYIYKMVNGNSLSLDALSMIILVVLTSYAALIIRWLVRSNI
jgi:hypothetical protein